MIEENASGQKCSLCCTKLENFGVTIGGKVLIHDVNLHIHCGELTVLIGPNGAGKTTLLRAILGEIPHSGTLNFLDAKGNRTGRPLVGYVPQRVEFDKNLPASVLDFYISCISNRPIWLWSSRPMRERVLQGLSRVQAEYLIDRKIGHLSGGELQRVLLACALDPPPNLLLLDEPVSGVDPSGLGLFYDMVSELRWKHDLSIILVSHDLALVARYATRMVLLNKTVLAVGEPVDVLNSEAFFKTFGQAVPDYCSLNRWPLTKR